jgi:septum formation inhibitor MinC
MKKMMIVAVCSLLGAAACKKSVSGQISQWTRNLTDLAEATAKYPNLKPLLDEKATAAKAIFAEAEKITNEEQKAAKIAAAISKLRENLGVVLEVKSKQQGIESTITKITKIRTSKDRARQATREVSSMRSELNSIERTMTELKP